MPGLFNERSHPVGVAGVPLTRAVGATHRRQDYRCEWTDGAPVTSVIGASTCRDRCDMHRLLNERRRVGMGEIENLVGVHREVRRAVSDDPPPEIAGLVPDLGEPGDVPGGIPGIDAALAALAQEAPPPECSYRRLLVVAALVRATADRFGSQGSDRQEAVAAIRPLTRDGSRRQAEGLFELCETPLHVEHEHDQGVMKRTLLACAIARRLIDVVTETKTATVRAPGGASRAQLRATAAVPGYTLVHVSGLLEPSNWQRLSGGRITMTPYPGGQLEDDVKRLYYEIFRITTRLKLTPRLEVKRQPPVKIEGDRRAQWLEYRLAETQSPGELVTRDQGSIVIRDTADGVRIATTKRVRLTPPFDAPSLAMQADAIGYFDAFDDMVRAALAASCRQRAV
jgi:hypothetical protein